jgi:hypothetical protein
VCTRWIGVSDVAADRFGKTDLSKRSCTGIEGDGNVDECRTTVEEDGDQEVRGRRSLRFKRASWGLVVGSGTEIVPRLHTLRQALPVPHNSSTPSPGRNVTPIPPPAAFEMSKPRPPVAPVSSARTLRSVHEVGSGNGSLPHMLMLPALPFEVT